MVPETKVSGPFFITEKRNTISQQKKVVSYNEMKRLGKMADIPTERMGVYGYDNQ